jgi:hypothetical protein
MKGKNKRYAPVCILFFICACTAAVPKPKPHKLQIFKIEPSSGPTYGGYPLFIIGNGFTPQTTVEIGGEMIEDRSLGQILLLKVPPGTEGKAEVKLTNPDKQTAVLKEGFVYNEYPIIKSINPDKGSVAGGSVVTIEGDGFTVETVVRFGGIKVEIQSITGNEIRVVTPPHTAGYVNVVATNPGGFSFGREEAFNYR